uniref:Uncharacterized protein n=1 Tax=Cannabis sativa TaxID=3483 RepID=A0A803Q7A0_CANSA
MEYRQEFAYRLSSLQRKKELFKIDREEEAESSNVVTDEDHRQILTKLENLKVLKRLSLELSLFKERIKIKEVKVFKHTLLDDLDTAKSRSKVFYGFNNVDFHKRLYEYMKPWTEKIIKEKGSGKKMTLLDSASLLNPFEEEDRSAFDSLKWTIHVDFGCKISTFIVSYFLMFLDWKDEPKEMRGRANMLEETIRCESLDEDGGILITSKLLSLITYFKEEDIFMGKKGKSVDNVCFDQRDHVFFGSFFNTVHFLVIVTSFPFFSVKLGNEDLMELKDFLIDHFVEKMKDVCIMIKNDIAELMESDRVYRDQIMERRRTFMEFLRHKNRELWK